MADLHGALAAPVCAIDLYPYPNCVLGTSRRNATITKRCAPSSRVPAQPGSRRGARRASRAPRAAERSVGSRIGLAAMRVRHPLMSPTTESVERSHSRITRWRVRDIVSSEVRLTIDQTLEALAAQGNSRHAELAVRFKSVALLQVPVVVTAQKESVGPTHESKPTAVPQHRWVIAPPNRDARMQQRAWNFWLEAIDSMEGEPRPSRRTMTVHVGAYLAAGEIPIATVEFSSFDCSMDEVSAMQRSDSDAVFSGQGLRSPWGESEIERLSLALELAPQLRLAHRAAAQWRDEFDVWRAFPPYDFCPPQPKATTTVPLTLDAWSQAIGSLSHAPVPAL